MGQRSPTGRRSRFFYTVNEVLYLHIWTRFVSRRLLIRPTSQPAEGEGSQLSALAFSRPWHAIVADLPWQGGTPRHDIMMYGSHVMVSISGQPDVTHLCAISWFQYTVRHNSHLGDHDTLQRGRAGGVTTIVLVHMYLTNINNAESAQSRLRMHVVVWHFIAQQTQLNEHRSLWDVTWTWLVRFTVVFITISRL